MNNNTNKYNKVFIHKDTYIDKALIVLGAITGGVSIIRLQVLWEHQLEQQVQVLL